MSSATSECKTFAPILEISSISAFTDTSFPGIISDENITVSVGLIEVSLMSPFTSLERAEPSCP